MSHCYMECGFCNKEFDTTYITSDGKMFCDSEMECPNCGYSWNKETKTWRINSSPSSMLNRKGRRNKIKR